MISRIAERKRAEQAEKDRVRAEEDAKRKVVSDVIWPEIKRRIVEAGEAPASHSFTVSVAAGETKTILPELAAFCAQEDLTFSEGRDYAHSIDIIVFFIHYPLYYAGKTQTIGHRLHENAKREHREILEKNERESAENWPRVEPLILAAMEAYTGTDTIEIRLNSDDYHAAYGRIVRYLAVQNLAITHEYQSFGADGYRRVIMIGPKSV